jgi:hypothetical protein
MDSATFPGKYFVKAISSANFFPSKYVMPQDEPRCGDRLRVIAAVQALLAV